MTKIFLLALLMPSLEAAPAAAMPDTRAGYDASYEPETQDQRTDVSRLIALPKEELAGALRAKIESDPSQAATYIDGLERRLDEGRPLRDKELALYVILSEELKQAKGDRCLQGQGQRQALCAMYERLTVLLKRAADRGAAKPPAGPKRPSQSKKLEQAGSRLDGMRDALAEGPGGRRVDAALLPRTFDGADVAEDRGVVGASSRLSHAESPSAKKVQAVLPPAGRRPPTQVPAPAQSPASKPPADPAQGPSLSQTLGSAAAAAGLAWDAASGLLRRLGLLASDPVRVEEERKLKGRDYSGVKIKYADGRTLESLAPGFVRSSKEGSPEAFYMLNLEELLGAPAGRARDERILAMAQGALDFMEADEGRRSGQKDPVRPGKEEDLRALRSFLEDAGGLAGRLHERFPDMAGLRLESFGFDHRGRFQLRFAGSGGDKVLLNARFCDKDFTQDAAGAPRRAFVLSVPIRVGPDLKPRGARGVERPWLGYLGPEQGRMLNEWLAPVEGRTERSVFSDQKTLSIRVRHWDRPDGAAKGDWTPRGDAEVFSGAEDIQGTSMGARMADAVGRYTPGFVTWTLDKASKVGQTAWYGFKGGVQYGMAGAMEDKLAALYAAGYFARSPGMRALAGDARYVDKMRRWDALGYVDGKAMEKRDAYLRSQGITERTVTPDVWRAYQQAPFSDQERMEALTDYGDTGALYRDMAKASGGLMRVAYYGGSAVATAGDVGGTMLCDPMTWATAGLGSATTALGQRIQTMRAAVAAGEAAPGLASALRWHRALAGANDAATMAFGSSMIGGVVDDTAAAVKAFADGDTDSLVSHGTDLFTTSFLLGKMVQSAREARASARTKPAGQGPGPGEPPPASLLDAKLAALEAKLAGLFKTPEAGSEAKAAATEAPKGELRSDVKAAGAESAGRLKALSDAKKVDVGRARKLLRPIGGLLGWIPGLESFDEAPRAVEPTAATDSRLAMVDHLLPVMLEDPGVLDRLKQALAQYIPGMSIDEFRSRLLEKARETPVQVMVSDHPEIWDSLGFYDTRSKGVSLNARLTEKAHSFQILGVYAHELTHSMGRGEHAAHAVESALVDGIADAYRQAGLNPDLTPAGQVEYKPNELQEDYARWHEKTVAAAKDPRALTARLLKKGYTEKYLSALEDDAPHLEAHKEGLRRQAAQAVKDEELLAALARLGSKQRMARAFAEALEPHQGEEWSAWLQKNLPKSEREALIQWLSRSPDAQSRRRMAQEYRDQAAKAAEDLRTLEDAPLDLFEPKPSLMDRFLAYLGR